MPLVTTLCLQAYTNWTLARPSQILHPAPLFQNGAKSGFEMCFGPSTLGAGAKTRLESRIKKFTPHCVCRTVHLKSNCPPLLLFQNGIKSDFAVYFAIGPQHQTTDACVLLSDPSTVWYRGSHPKHGLHPDSERMKFKPHLINIYLICCLGPWQPNAAGGLHGDGCHGVHRLLQRGRARRGQTTCDACRIRDKHRSASISHASRVCV